MNVLALMAITAFLTVFITIIIAIRKKYSVGESFLWGLLALIIVAIFGGTQGLIPMLICAVGVIYIATRMTPYNQLPKKEDT